MSDNVPFDIQVEIIKRLPVKSLIKFRSVFKAWKSLIDSSRFIKHYSGQQQHLLVSYYEDRAAIESEKKYVSVVDDDTFPKQKVHVTPPITEMLTHSRLIGSSHGLVCFEGCGTTVVWNISIRKAVTVDVPSIINGTYDTILGFGVCRETMDPKIVKIRHIIHILSRKDMESISCIPWQVEIFTLSTGNWRSLADNLPRKSIYFCSSWKYDYIAIDGVFYWIAIDRITVDGGIRNQNMIISFDMTSEEFREVNLPHSLTHRFVGDLLIYNLRESLVVLQRDGVEPNNPCFIVWMMEDGVPKSFTKLFTFNTPNVSKPLEFRKSGELIIEILELEYDRGMLAVYEPHSKHIDNIGIDGLEHSFFLCSYMETLLLLDHPNFIVYNKDAMQYDPYQV